MLKKLTISVLLLTALAFGLLHPLPDGAAELPLSAVVWKREVQEALNRNRSYAEHALSRREQGLVVVEFTLDRSGRLVSIDVVRASCSAELDSEAVDMVRRSSPFPAPPDEMADRVELRVPVRFIIDGIESEGCGS
jgi:protein TonB